MADSVIIHRYSKHTLRFNYEDLFYNKNSNFRVYIAKVNKVTQVILMGIKLGFSWWRADFNFSLAKKVANIAHISRKNRPVANLGSTIFDELYRNPSK